jgi:hypothetical protein
MHLHQRTTSQQRSQRLASVVTIRIASTTNLLHEQRRHHKVGDKAFCLGTQVLVPVRTVFPE